MNSFVNTKQAIAQHFGRAAETYHTQAHMQKNCARQLLRCLPSSFQLPAGAILEIGCGTGFITQGLVDRFPERLLDITDLSPEMLQFCQSQLQVPEAQHQRVRFRQMDGEAIDRLAPDARPYALIVSGFAIQWFQDPVQSLRRWLTYLAPGGAMLLSFPTCHSFPEWKQVCLELNLPFTANPFPDVAEVLMDLDPDLQVVESIEQEIAIDFADVKDFFRSLKIIGAGVSQTGKRLSPRQMRLLIHYWNRREKRGIAEHPITVHFNVWFGVLQR